MNDYSFNELEMLKEIKKTIKQAFRTDESKPNDYWYNLFGKRDIKAYDSVQVDEPQFPCFVVKFRSFPNFSTRTSQETEQFSQVYVTIEHYNQKVDNLGKEELGLLINHRLKTVLQKTYNILITNNQQVGSPNESIYRRRIDAELVFDNKHKIIYQGG